MIESSAETTATMSPSLAGVLDNLAPERSEPEMIESSPGRRRETLRLLLTAILVVAVGISLRLTIFASKPVRVDVAKAVLGTVEHTVSNTRAGTVESRVRAHLSPEIGGRVVAIPVQEGERVEQGQLLLRLDSSLQQARLDLAEEDLRVARASAEETCLGAEQAANELARFTQLAARGITSDQQLDSLTSSRDRSSAGCRAARAAIGQAEARRRFARAELNLTELHAPFAGVLAQIHTELGEWLTPSPPGMNLPPALDLLDPSSVYVAAPIDEMDAARVVPGQSVRISVDSHAGISFFGHLVRVAAFVYDAVEQNRTVEVEAEFDDPAAAVAILPGTSADVEIIIDRRQEVLQIPTGAISEGDRVLVVVDGALVERSLETGLRNWRTTEVRSGLEPGDLVVTTGDRPGVEAGALVEIGSSS